MAKIKEALYLERLKKWREEKQKKQEEIKKQNTIKPFRKVDPYSGTDNLRRKTFDVKSLPGRPLPKNTIKHERSNKGPKAVVNATKPLHSKHIDLNRKKTIIPSKPASNTIPKKIQKPNVTPKTTNLVRPVQEPSANCTESYLQKYEQWKKEREKTRSEKKTIPQRVRQISGNQNEKPVKARKNKQEKEEQARTSNSRGLKRRHSVALDGPAPKKKPCSILKRKSCFGSIDHDENKHNALGDGAGNEEKVPITPKTPSRNVRFISPDCREVTLDDGVTHRKTPVKRQELKNWLKMNNRTPSKFRHLLCFEHDHHINGKDPVQDVLTKVNLTVDELSEQANILELERLNMEAVKKLDSMLEECMTLFEAGCPVEAILPWLDDIHKKVPQARTFVKFYKCKVEVLKASLDLDALLQIIEEATINDAQPKVELAKLLTETVQFITDEKVKQAKKNSRARRRSEVQEENVFASSAIVYSVGNVTPFSNQKRPEANSSQSSDCKVVTPVRRSTRRSLQNLPDSLKDKRTLTSLEELPNKDNVLFHPNLALGEVLLACDND